MRVRVRAHSLVLPSDTAVWPSVHTLRAPGHVRHSLRCAWACPDPAGQRCPVRAQRLLKRRRRPRQHSAATVCSRTDPLLARALPGRAPSCLKRKDFHESCLEGKQEEFAHVDCASRTELLSASVRPPPSARVKAATGAGRSRVHRGVCGSPRLRVSPLSPVTQDPSFRGSGSLSPCFLHLFQNFVEDAACSPASRSLPWSVPSTASS